MTKKKFTSPQWLELPEEHDYPAAASYLALTYAEKKVVKLVALLRKAPLSHFKAKDIFKASSLSLLGISNSHYGVDEDAVIPCKIA
jgi:hypothetical protein